MSSVTLGAGGESASDAAAEAAASTETIRARHEAHSMGGRVYTAGPLNISCQ